MRNRILTLPPSERSAPTLSGKSYTISFPSKPRKRVEERERSALLIEGYASLFGVADASGDVVRAGAFARSLKAGAVPMLLQHRSGAVAGRWTRMVEDGRGLFVRGLIEGDGARVLVRGGLNGLSIGFRPRVWTPRPSTSLRMSGRTLADVELVEVSLVAEPMLSGARFQVV